MSRRAENTLSQITDEQQKCTWSRKVYWYQKEAEVTVVHTTEVWNDFHNKEKAGKKLLLSLLPFLQHCSTYGGPINVSGENYHLGSDR